MHACLCPAGGLGTQQDPAAHAAQREVLSPAFRPDYVRGQARMLAACAARLAGLLRRQVRCGR